MDILKGVDVKIILLDRDPIFRPKPMEGLEFNLGRKPILSAPSGLDLSVFLKVSSSVGYGLPPYVRPRKCHHWLSP